MELMAARNTLRHISAMLHGVVTFVVDLYVDNTTAKSWLSKQRSRTYVANEILLELSWFSLSTICFMDIVIRKCRGLCVPQL
jgi:hypothetical protein